MNMRQGLSNKMPIVKIYCDGFCLESEGSGTGGWAAILNYKHYEKKIRGCERNTTKNRMDLKAVIAGLSTLKKPCNVIVYITSPDIAKSMFGNTNNDLWNELSLLSKIHEVKFELVIHQPDDHETIKIAEQEARLLKEEKDELF